MAAWQFDIHCLPVDIVKRFYGDTPLTISRADFEQKEWWQDNQLSRDLKTQLATLLPPLSSWSENIQMWGYKDGDRIDLVWDNGDVLKDIFIRIDVRNISRVFLIRLLELTRKNNCLFLTQDGYVVLPSFEKLLSFIEKSDAFRFVQNPKDFYNNFKD